MFALADGATQTKLRAAADKAHAAASTDADVHDLVGKFGADPSAAADVLAGAMLAATADALTDDGKTTAIHLEDGHWRATLAPYGFAIDGAPIVVHARLATDPAPVTAGTSSYEVHFDFDGMTEADVAKHQHEALVEIAKVAKLPAGWLADAEKIFAFYSHKLGTDGASNDVAFEIGNDGSITATLKAFDRDRLTDVSHATVLRYGDL